MRQFLWADYAVAQELELRRQTPKKGQVACLFTLNVIIDVDVGFSAPHPLVHHALNLFRHLAMSAINEEAVLAGKTRYKHMEGLVEWDR